MQRIFQKWREVSRLARLLNRHHGTVHMLVLTREQHCMRDAIDGWKHVVTDVREAEARKKMLIKHASSSKNIMSHLTRKLDVHAVIVAWKAVRARRKRADVMRRQMHGLSEMQAGMVAYRAFKDWADDTVRQRRLRMTVAQNNAQLREYATRASLHTVVNSKFDSNLAHRTAHVFKAWRAGFRMRRKYSLIGKILETQQDSHAAVTVFHAWKQQFRRRRRILTGFDAIVAKQERRTAITFLREWREYSVGVFAEVVPRSEHAFREWRSSINDGHGGEYYSEDESKMRMRVASAVSGEDDIDFEKLLSTIEHSRSVLGLAAAGLSGGRRSSWEDSGLGEALDGEGSDNEDAGVAGNKAPGSFFSRRSVQSAGHKDEREERRRVIRSIASLNYPASIQARGNHRSTRDGISVVRPSGEAEPLKHGEGVDRSTEKHLDKGARVSSSPAKGTFAFYGGNQSRVRSSQDGLHDGTRKRGSVSSLHIQKGERDSSSSSLCGTPVNVDTTASGGHLEEPMESSFGETTRLPSGQEAETSLSIGASRAIVSRLRSAQGCQTSVASKKDNIRPTSSLTGSHAPGLDDQPATEKQFIFYNGKEKVDALSESKFSDDATFFNDGQDYSAEENDHTAFVERAVSSSPSRIRASARSRGSMKMQQAVGPYFSRNSQPAEQFEDELAYRNSRSSRPRFSVGGPRRSSLMSVNGTSFEGNSVLTYAASRSSLMIHALWSRKHEKRAWFYRWALHVSQRGKQFRHRVLVGKWGSYVRGLFADPVARHAQQPVLAFALFRWKLYQKRTADERRALWADNRAVRFRQW
ncbi:unnamed protein product, partial [Amoebophrya sp. A25]|eukprot:GSA25T00015242001.1